MTSTATALIAEDEPLLANILANELHALWPELRVVATAGDGLSAVQLGLQHRPDMLFFDIRMPGQSGLEAVAELAEEWPEGTPFPLLVFVTAYDNYAVAAFEAQAIDYVLKPVRTDRLAATVARLQGALKERRKSWQTLDGLEPVWQQLRALMSVPTLRPPPAQPPLQLLQASVGQQLHMVPVAQVLLLEASDKYVRILTRDGQDLWLRTPLKELLARLDEAVFWQIHRSTVVRADAIARAWKDEQGQWRVQLQQGAQTYKVSRLFAHRFRAM